MLKLDKLFESKKIEDIKIDLEAQGFKVEHSPDGFILLEYIGREPKVVVPDSIVCIFHPCL